MKEYNKQQFILIVDDSKLHCRYLSSILEDKYIVKSVRNGRDALALVCSDDPPDLILLDVVMPEISGYEVCKKLKEMEKTKNIPIIFITGKIEEEDEILAFELGAVDYISKPFNAILVQARVNTQIKLKCYQDYLKSISYLDGLTQIPNRRKFDDYFELMWDFSLRENREVSVIMMDIDYFKLFNDTYGHQVGDECLKKIAKQLQKTITRKTDFVGRYGGEEFVCALPNTNLEDAFMVAEKMRQAIVELKIPHEGSKILNIVTISLGIATTTPQEGEKRSSIIEKADKALYHSKELGRNRSSS